jgi:spoIIIJ-associated protein
MNSDSSVEFVGESVEDAIALGLKELGVSPADVIVEVLEEPSRGVFGIGARPARVRLQLLGGRGASEATSISTPVSAPVTPVSSETVISEPPPQPEPPISKVSSYEESETDEEDAAMPLLVQSEEVPENEIEEEAAVGKVVLGELLERMSVRADIVVRRAHAGDERENAPWILDVTGANLNRLIGRRGETLAALQYITRLVTSRELQRRADIIVDVDSYKARRARSLYSLAQRMAAEAVERNRAVALEPMPPHERRIIHLALRGRTDVATKSVGEGENRKVTIVPQS